MDRSRPTLLDSQGQTCYNRFMAWKVSATVTAISGTSVSASGTATGTDDDSTIQNVNLTLTYSEVPSHITVGSVFDVDADC